MRQPHGHIAPGQAWPTCRSPASFRGRTLPWGTRYSPSSASGDMEACQFTVQHMAVLRPSFFAKFRASSLASQSSVQARALMSLDLIKRFQPIAFQASTSASRACTMPGRTRSCRCQSAHPSPFKFGLRELWGSGTADRLFDLPP